MSNIVSIGVDVGSKNGAIAIISADMNILYLAKAPFFTTEIKSKKVKPKLNKETMLYETSYKKRAWTDYTALRDIYKPYLKKHIIYTVEKVSPNAGEYEATSFNFGNSLGIHQGQYSLLNPIMYFEPRPQEWKKELGLSSDKNESIQMVGKVFEVDLKNYVDKGKVDDVAEALLLASFGLKKYFDNIN